VKAMRDSKGAQTVRLKISGLHAWYGESHVLHGISFEVREGEVVTLLGRNGAGKTTTARSIMGVVGRREGSIEIDGRESIGLYPESIARLGVGYCPEERGIFAGLSVAENLMLPPVVQPGGLAVAEIHRLFPNLAERSRSSGAKLSGGEQQMLAIGRILRTGARILILDEPTEGLAPVIVGQIARALNKLKEVGFTILLVEQSFRFAASISDRHYLVENGQVAAMYTRDDLMRHEDKLRERLGV
jgi:branched-chain amino acid transport system ATP-binding protein